MIKLKALHPINPELAPFQVGEVIAFREDHDTHGATMHEDGSGMTAPSKYGVIREIGLSDGGELAFNVVTYDSINGPPSVEDPANYQATMEEIQ